MGKYFCTHRHLDSILRKKKHIMWFIVIFKMIEIIVNPRF